MKPPFIRSEHNYDRNAVSQETGLECLDKSLAKQSFRDECDINTIYKRFMVTGELPATRQPTYEDYVEVHDFRSAMEAIVQAREAFAAMPADVRAEFGNDPANFVDFCSNEENRDRIRQLGMMSPDAYRVWEQAEKAKEEASAALQRDAELYRASQGDSTKAVT
ncbi:MAG: internal scaffolding protein [Microvirus sp.]|nr:MAG: internal scaffolding protein [Microvirus sp.]